MSKPTQFTVSKTNGLKDAVVAVRMNKELHYMVKLLAEEAQITMSNLITQMIEYSLNSMKEAQES